MRSSPVTEKAGRLLREGAIGQVKVARAWTAELRTEVKPSRRHSPDGVDYDRWLGPAPQRPSTASLPSDVAALSRLRERRNRRRRIHDLDMAAWGLGIDTLPKQITARGGRMMLTGHVSDIRII